jgi:hypothetical protein
MHPVSPLNVTVVVVSRLLLFTFRKKGGVSDDELTSIDQYPRVGSQIQTCGPVSKHTKRETPSDNHNSEEPLLRSLHRGSISVTIVEK